MSGIKINRATNPKRQQKRELCKFWDMGNLRCIAGGIPKWPDSCVLMGIPQAMEKQEGTISCPDLLPLVASCKESFSLLPWNDQPTSVKVKCNDPAEVTVLNGEAVNILFNVFIFPLESAPEQQYPPPQSHCVNVFATLKLSCRSSSGVHTHLYVYKHHIHGKK